MDKSTFAVLKVPLLRFQCKEIYTFFVKQLTAQRIVKKLYFQLVSIFNIILMLMVKVDNF